jgi:hypothetical protein
MVAPISEEYKNMLSTLIVETSNKLKAEQWNQLARFYSEQHKKAFLIILHQGDRMSLLKKISPNVTRTIFCQNYTICNFYRG